MPTSTHPPRPAIRRAGAAAALGLVVALGACGNQAQPGGDMSGMPGMSSSAASPSPSASAPAAVGDADVMFAQMMIPHHQQAVQMSDLILAKSGVDPQVTTLAKQIKAAQAPEIKTMTGWLTSWGKPTDASMGGMHHGDDDGMMSAADLQKLEQADGPAAQKLYLTGMIKHHQGAVTMAQTEIKDGQQADAVSLARNIVSTQQAEIATMRKIVARL